MAFRLEIVDEFRIEGLASEIYRDIVRYGLFIRDSRGKSVRGTFVPRLYLRRLLLPYSALALSKRDSVPFTCDQFISLLLRPDAFKSRFSSRTSESSTAREQLDLWPSPGGHAHISEPAYDDLSENQHERNGLKRNRRRR